MSGIMFGYENYDYDQKDLSFDEGNSDSGYDGYRNISLDLRKREFSSFIRRCKEQTIEPMIFKFPDLKKSQNLNSFKDQVF